jgi:hypothetical protein
MDDVYDVTAAMAPKSDQINADDLIAGPITVKIVGINLQKVTGEKGQQPLSIQLEGRKPYRPCKSMMRVLSSEWGSNAAKWIGRSLTLKRDPSVKFGGDTVGGIRISHMSHIQKRSTIALTVTRGQRAPYTVEPLTVAADAPARDPGPTAYATFTATLAAKGIDPEALSAWWADTNPADGHPRTWVRGLAEFAADVIADGSPILARFRAASGGAS